MIIAHVNRISSAETLEHAVTFRRIDKIPKMSTTPLPVAAANDARHNKSESKTVTDTIIGK